MSGPVLTANSPSAGYISWTAFHIQYLGVSYAIPAGNTANKYTWWPFNGGLGGPLQSTDTFPTTLTDDDLLLFLNKNGVGVNAQTATVIDGSLIVPESILAEAIAAKSITADKVYITGTPMEWLVNGSFDTELAPHTVTNQVTSYSIDPANSRSGTGAALKLVFPALNTGWDNPVLYFMGNPGTMGNHIPVKQNQTVHGELWVKGDLSDNPEGLSAGIIVNFYDKNGVQIGSGFNGNNDYMPGGASGTYPWTLLTVDAVCNEQWYGAASANVAYAVMYLANSYCHAGATMWVDDASMKAKMDGSLIVDGTITATALETQLELVTHIVAPANLNTFDWVTTPTTLSAGATATTGGTMANHKYVYYIAAMMPNGLLTQRSKLSVDLTGSATSTNTQVINWTAVTDAVSYRLWRFDATLGGSTYIQATIPTGTTFTDTGAGWSVQSGGFVTNLSQARVDINPGGLDQYDFDNNLTTHFSNNGGATFYQQTTFGVTPGDNHILTQRVEQDTTGSGAYAAFLGFLQFTGHGGALTYNQNADGTEQLTMSQSTGDQSSSFMMGTHADGTAWSEWTSGVYTHIYADPTGIEMRPNASAGGKITLNGDTVISGDVTVDQHLDVLASNDASNSAGNNPPLRVGDPSGIHLRIDGNEIIAMVSDSTQGTLNLNLLGTTHVADMTAGGNIVGSANVTGDKLFANNPDSTTLAANVHMPSGGQVQRISSLNKFKVEQEHLTVDGVLGLLDLTPKTWYDLSQVAANGGSTEGLRRIPGVVAEDVQEHAPTFAIYNDQGDLQGVAYDRIGVALIPLVRDLVDRVEELEASTIKS